MGNTPNEIRKQQIHDELDNLRSRREAIPLTEEEKKHQIGNFSEHFELSEQINELEIELDALNAANE